MDYPTTSTLDHNSTSIPLSSLLNPPFGAPIGVALFFIGVCIVHTMTTPVPIPNPIGDTWCQALSMILGPVGVGCSSFNSIVILAVKIARRKCGTFNNHVPHDAISAGALAIRIPRRFTGAIVISPFGWRKLKNGIPLIDIDAHAFATRSYDPTPRNGEDDTILYCLPPTSRVNMSIKLFPATNKLNSAFAILQLIYSLVQAYIQFDPLIRIQGLSSPFIIAIPYLYMSLINLMANLAQGSYTHVTIIPPARKLRQNSTTPPPSIISQFDPSTDGNIHEAIIASVDASTSTAITPQIHDVGPLSQELGETSVEHDLEMQNELNQVQPETQNEDVSLGFNHWLETHFPQVEIEEHRSLSSIAYFAHYTLALAVVLTSIGLLTGFQTGDSPSSFLLLATILDPLLHLTLAAGQAWVSRPRWATNILRGLGAVGTIKLLSWAFNLLGCHFAGKTLLQIYEGDY